MPSNKSVQSLNIKPLVRIAKKDPNAFGQLYDLFARDVYRYHFSRVGNHSDADDLTSQTFLTVLEELPRYRERGKFKSWLFTIAHHRLMDHFRNKPTESLSDAITISDQINIESDLIQNEKISKLSELIHGLDEKGQELLRLRYVVDLNFSEIAAVLGLRTDAVKKAIYRIQANLHSLMEIQSG